LDHKFILLDVLVGPSTSHGEFINTAHVQRVFIVDNNVTIELVSGVILTLTATCLNTVIEKFYS
jgi:hypothetical protein